jgi:serine/threonine protein kinase/Tfp pilus assembly protein PilF
MGVVYEAQQVSLGRRVALKILPFAAVMDQRRLARFKTEAQAAAQLIHQNIVPVFSVGCELGVHFYAMQYVDGQTLAEAIGQLRRSSGLDPREPATEPRALAASASNSLAHLAASACGSDDANRETRFSPVERSANAAGVHGSAETAPIAALSTEKSNKDATYFRTVASVGVQAAEALDHAHKHGILHRDVKPANLMLDITGNLWVTDFGLARMDGNPQMTMTGDLIGTLRYMSPEQALAKRVIVDHRTDIYSLGVTLYELLTLEPAFPGRDREEVLRQIAFDEPRAPRRIEKTIPAELETIILKAMAKNPEERYGTAQDLADDLRCYLLDRPIRARRPSLVRRMRQWSRRHRAVVNSAVALILMSIVGLSITTVLLSHKQAEIIEERDRAVENYQEAERQRQRADREASKAKTEGAIAKAVTEFLNDDLLARADPSSEPERHLELRTVLDRAADKIEGRFQDQSLVEAAIRTTLGKTYLRLGEDRKAETQLRRALEVRVRELGPDHSETLNSMSNLAHATEGKEAGKIHEQVLETRRRDLGPENLETLNAAHTLGRFLARQGQREAGRELYEQSLEISRRVFGPESPETLKAMAGYGGLLYDTERELDEARKVVEQTLEIRRRVLGPEHMDTLDSMVQLAVVYLTDGKGDEARKLLEPALEVFQRVLGPDADATIYTTGLLANVLNGKEKLEALEKCLEDDRRRYGPEHPKTLGHSMHNLALALHEQGKFDEARKLNEKIVEVTRRVFGSTDPRTPDAIYHLVRVLASQGKLDEAQDLLDEAIAGYRELLRLRPDHQKAHEQFAWMVVARNECDPALAKEAVVSGQKCVESWPLRSNSWRHLGWALYHDGQYQAAIDALHKSIEVVEQRDSSGNPYQWFFLAMAHWRLGFGGSGPAVVSSQDDESHGHEDRPSASAGDANSVVASPDHFTEARQWYDKSVEWMQTKTSNDPWLRLFRAKAEEVMATVSRGR